ncbi:MAG: hypothetical protein WAO00_13520 [Chthoniobacterales bacterium]
MEPKATLTIDSRARTQSMHLLASSSAWAASVQPSSVPSPITTAFASSSDLLLFPANRLLTALLPNLGTPRLPRRSRA